MRLNPAILADCNSTVNVAPPMLKVFERSDPVFGDTSNVTVPLPVPDAGLVSVTHVGSGPTAHEHVAPVVIAMLPVPPAAVNASPPELSE
jgi:hypothetical protein